MKYTIAITGLPRTGTTSLWRTYGEHPEITRSRRKEPLQTWNENILDKYIYYNYIIKENTKVLLDGSTNIITFKTELIKKVKQIPDIERFCCIYTVRDPIERTLSQVNNFLRNYFRGNLPRPIFLNNDLTINEYHLNVFFCYMLDEPNIIKNLENIIGLENIFFISINKIFIDQQRIFSALGIRNNIQVESRKLNRTVDLVPTLKQLQILIKIKDWVKDNETRLEEISKKSKDMIQEKYLKELY
jgi:hypothetical protein